VINAPALGVTWGGVVGVGAWSFSVGGGKQPIRVSDIVDLAEARVVASRSHRSQVLEDALKMLGARSLDPLGSAGLKCAEVAWGRAEAYVAPGRAGHRWDVCAGHAIVVAAGGRVSDGRNQPLDYRTESLANEHGLLITNGGVHEAIFERVSTIRPPR
jgi:3'(2'), 5'-bisphosphate nucleotidase